MITHDVWAAIGNPKSYIEPFFGSGAVLINRPIIPTDDKQYEIVCDKDGFIANVWRGLKFAPHEVEEWCDWPVNHADLNARRKRLLAESDRLLAKLCADDMFYDAKLAGYWIWCASCWIGSGLTCADGIPNIVWDNGVTAVRGQIPNITHDQGVTGNKKSELRNWFDKLSARLRYVKVVCGDWMRVCGGNWQDINAPVGIFFDPPYGIEDRDTRIYHHDSTTVSADVMSWCADRGDKSTYRIVLCGYEEYSDLLKIGWRVKHWSAQGGYGRIGKKETRGKENRHRECIYFSPHCLRNDDDLPLFDS